MQNPPPLPPRRRNPASVNASYVAGPRPQYFPQTSLPPPIRLTSPPPRPIYSVPIPVRRPRVKANNKKPTDDFFQDFWKQIVAALSNEIVVMTVVIVVAVVALHLNDHEEGPLKKLIAYLKKNGKSTALGTFVETHVDKLIGAIIFIPTIWPIRRDRKVPVIIFIAFWILVTPSFAAYVYFFQAITVYLYLKLQKSSHKIIIVFIAGFIFMIIYANIPSQSPPLVQGDQSQPEQAQNSPQPSTQDTSHTQTQTQDTTTQQKTHIQTVKVVHENTTHTKEQPVKVRHPHKHH